MHGQGAWDTQARLHAHRELPFLVAIETKEEQLARAWLTSNAKHEQTFMSKKLIRKAVTARQNLCATYDGCCPFADDAGSLPVEAVHHCCQLSGTSALTFKILMYENARVFMHMLNVFGVYVCVHSSRSIRG